MKNWDYTGKGMMYLSLAVILLGFFVDYRCLLIGCTTLVVGALYVLIGVSRAKLVQLEAQTQALKEMNMRIKDLRDYAEQDKIIE